MRGKLLQADWMQRTGRAVVAALLFAFAVGARAAESIIADLGDGLGYCRGHEIPADLPPRPPEPRALVLDLRFATAGPTAGKLLDAWLEFRATPSTPVLVLVNGATAPELGAVLAANRARPGLLTIGRAAGPLVPDIIVAASPDADRQAYDALEHGGAPAALLAEHVDKPRADEAAIMRERANPPPVDEDDDDVADVNPPPAMDAHPAPAPVVDLTLRRAVQVHRALRALRKL